MSERKIVAVQLSRQATPSSLKDRWSLELEGLKSVADIVEVQASSPAEFGAGAANADALITSWGIVIDRSVISQLKKCVVIGVGSIGVDMVDVDAATEAGIVVTNVPDVFIEEVADHAMMLLLSAGRRVKMTNNMAADGRWYQGRTLLSAVPRLMGRTLALLAFGSVARCTARRAQAFGMHVIAHDPFVSELTMSELGVEPVGFNELFERADYLSVHAPLNADTRHLVDAHALSLLKPSAVVINTARGGLIDEAALIDALQNKAIAAAGLDVLEVEPPAADNPLLTMENVVVTPHVASATTRMRPETRRRVGREVALVLKGKWPLACVNPTVLPRVPLERWQPYPMNRGPNR